MNKQYDNRILLGILLALALVYFLTDLARNRSRSNSALPAVLTYFDPAEIEGIALYPQTTGGDKLQFKKNGDAPGRSLMARSPHLPMRPPLLAC